ncbi:MAG: F0F1 ATP synthase subunit epsilon [Methylobacteriaceae bacterium]|nr:F0F1 ATP synthase subunit epsilon [Methylobacteriaceae bacterium]
MAAFHFELVSPERVLFSGDVESVVAPGADGDMTILKDHAPLMTTLRPGVVSVTDASGKSSKLFVRGGFADVNAKGFILLAEQALPLDQLDAAAIDREIRNASEDVADAKDGEAKRRAQEKLDQLSELKAALRI